MSDNNVPDFSLYRHIAHLSIIVLSRLFRDRHRRYLRLLQQLLVQYLVLGKLADPEYQLITTPEQSFSKNNMQSMCTT